MTTETYQHTYIDALGNELRVEYEQASYPSGAVMVFTGPRLYRVSLNGRKVDYTQERIVHQMDGFKIVCEHGEVTRVTDPPPIVA